MTQEEYKHPIVPPPELMRHWARFQGDTDPEALWFRIATEAAQWGSDQELEACCKWLPKLPPWSGDDLRRHRRPQPPSLKEQALELARPAGTEGAYVTFGPEELALIRRALEQLDD